MQTEHKIKLTSAEVANIWTAFQGDTMSICVFEFFLIHVEDKEIRSVVEFAMQLSQAHVQRLTAFFREEKLTIPNGFTVEEDVNKQAPMLFTDDFMLFYIQNMGKLGLKSYTLSLSNSARLDMCEYFTECLNESAKLFNKATEIMLSKGTFIRAPYVPESMMVEYIHKDSSVAGWFSEKRPLNVIEMSSIYFNMIQNQLGRTLTMGFSQVAKSQKVRDYLVRGRDISDKHVEIFGSVLSEDHLPATSAWSTLPTNSIIAPFSDKLMMFHVVTLNGIGIANYGASAGTSMRHDLGIIYVRLAAEVAKFAGSGLDIMMENAWLEQPPQAADRDKLAKR